MSSNTLYKGVYAKMEKDGKFPKYSYSEYPKMISLKNGKRMKVSSQAEELRMIDEVVPVANIAKLEADKGNLEKLLAESQARLEELKKELEAGKHKPEPAVVEPEKPAKPAPLTPPVPPAPKS